MIFSCRVPEKGDFKKPKVKIGYPPYAACTIPRSDKVLAPAEHTIIRKQCSCHCHCLTREELLLLNTWHMYVMHFTHRLKPTRNQGSQNISYLFDIGVALLHLMCFGKPNVWPEFGVIYDVGRPLFTRMKI